MPSHKYKLTYFPVRARAELTRLVFAAAGVQYEDNRVKGEDWPALKESLPMGFLPLLEVDGHQIGQSLTVARFVAREHGLMGKNSIEQALVEQVVETAGRDLRVEFFDLGLMFEKDEQKKAEKMKKFKEVTGPKYFTILEKLLKLNNGGDEYYVGSNLTLADIAVYDGIYDIVERGIISLELYPKLEAHRKRIQALPRIAEWLKKRPQTDF